MSGKLSLAPPSVVGQHKPPMFSSGCITADMMNNNLNEPYLCDDKILFESLNLMLSPYTTLNLNICTYIIKLFMIICIKYILFK